MKRLIALTILCVLCLGTALATEWPEGLGPGKPYSTVPEINLDEKLGYMMFYPSEDMPVTGVCRTLRLYLPREDVRIGDGTLKLCTDKNGAIQTIDMSDETLIQLRPMTEAEKAMLLWGGGVCVDIALPQSLTLGQTYYVTMTQGCIVTESGIESAELKRKNSWRFTLNGDWGVSALRQAGDEISFDLVLGGEAQSASLYSRDSSVDFPVSFAQSSGPMTGMATGDSPTWGVMFFDAEGNLLNQMEF